MCYECNDFEGPLTCSNQSVRMLEECDETLTSVVESHHPVCVWFNGAESEEEQCSGGGSGFLDDIQEEKRGQFKFCGFTDDPPATGRACCLPHTNTDNQQGTLCLCTTDGCNGGHDSNFQEFFQKADKQEACATSDGLDSSQPLPRLIVVHFLLLIILH
ncbi:uncharacterized protein LOC119736106 [Patiria miniata]|uniref:Uncharacterized protein n=1 Tax=Patiria miniata TaxID=46514 RepID=A0A914ARM9_PATMI|nr:uncharacterized protein LOC119736106 [Patiria miniata]